MDPDIVFLEELRTVEQFAITIKDEESNHRVSLTPDLEEEPRRCESDSGTGRSSGSSIENRDPREDDDVICLKSVEDFPAISLKNWSRQKVVERKMNPIPHYNEKLGPVRSGPAGDAGEGVGQDRRPSQSPSSEPRSDSRFRVPQARPALPKRVYPPGYHGSSLNLKAEVKEEPAQKPAVKGWFQTNLGDGFRSVSAPPDRQPPWADRCASPSSGSDVAEEEIEAVVRSASRASPESNPAPRSVVPRKAATPVGPPKYTVVARATTQNAFGPIEKYCEEQQFPIVGGIKITSRPEDAMHEVEFDFPDGAMANTILRKFDGTRVPNSDCLLFVALKDAQNTAPAGGGARIKSNHEWNASRNQSRPKRPWQGESMTHEKLDDQLDGYFRDRKRRSIPEEPEAEALAERPLDR